MEICLVSAYYLFHLKHYKINHTHTKNVTFFNNLFLGIAFRIVCMLIKYLKYYEKLHEISSQNL